MVPMLVPLIDMFNHGGMQTRMLLSDPAEPQHNVRHGPTAHQMKNMLMLLCLLRKPQSTYAGSIHQAALRCAVLGP